MTEFDKYIRQGEPDQKEKAAAWQVAIGLQDVDGLKPSEYLIQTAQQHIEGDISIDEVKHPRYRHVSPNCFRKRLSRLHRTISCIFINVCSKVYTSMQGKYETIISQRKNGYSTEIRLSIRIMK